MVDVVAGLYPFSTQDGQPIPLDIIKSNGLIPIAFGASSQVSVTLQSDAEVAIITANQACVVSIGTPPVNPLVSGTEYENCYYIPYDTSIAIAVQAGLFSVQGLGIAGTAYVQLIQRWAGLGLARQYTKK